MDFSRLVVPVFVFVIFVGGAFAAYQVADLGQDDAAKNLKTVENESISQQVGIWQLVSKSTDRYTAGFNDTVTVYNSSDVELEEGTDYEWNETDGAIYFYDTASTTDGNSANITYDYYENTEEVKEISGPIGVLTRGVGQMGYFAGGIALVIFLLALGGLLAKKFTDDGPRSNR